MSNLFSGIPDLVADRSLSFQQQLGQAAQWLHGLYQRGSFNGTVLIAEDGKVVFEQPYGFADVAGTIPLTPHSSFSLASVSKQFTGMAMMLLAHRRRLSLDDALAIYVPELTFYRGITIRHLLHHTSGLPDYMTLAEAHRDRGTPVTAQDVVQLLQHYAPPVAFRPGDEFEYSNTGYALLEAVLTRVSGQSYPDFMKAEIFDPLGMADSSAFNLSSRECSLQQRVFGCRVTLAGFGSRELFDLNFLDGVYGDGGIYSSARDLVRWDQALRDGSLIPASVYQQAYVPGRLNNGATTSYGFGWEIVSADVVEHWGEWQAFSALIRRDLARRTLLVVLSNLAPSSRVDTICKELSLFVDDIT